MTIPGLTEWIEQAYRARCDAKTWMKPAHDGVVRGEHFWWELEMLASQILEETDD